MTAPLKSFLLSLVLVIAFSAKTIEAEAACGEPGRANFNVNGFLQGYEGELFSATHCYTEGSYCDSLTLPEAARGSRDTVLAFYGTNITNWCTSLNTDFSYVFYNLIYFNEPISWTVSRATDMSYMFYNATSFNQDITGWDVSETMNFFGVFAFASAFNQPLNDWDVSKGEDFYGMFYGAASFNQDLSKWDTSKSMSFGSMFANATQFNQDISPWNVSQGCMFNLMFMDAASFAQDLNPWAVHLYNKTCDDIEPDYYLMFTRTACTITSDPLVSGSFCQPASPNATFPIGKMGMTM
ncbi:hypothetical protein MPSEU_000145100 [Mayamaea pseudoterrestris]|nr:hypothetical protein MPSEU_000145100 [Mayamaea pseudoterrestris]